MVTSYRENRPAAGRRIRNQDHGMWLSNRMSESGKAYAACGAERNVTKPYLQRSRGSAFPPVRRQVAVYVTEPRVMLWGGRKSGIPRFSRPHHKYRN